MSHESDRRDAPTEASAPTRRVITPDELQRLVEAVASIPRRWTIVMLGTAMLTVAHVDRGVDGNIAVSFQVGNLTLVALALIWLPMLIRVFALVGGSFKVAGVEATVSGVLTEALAIDLNVKARQLTGAQGDADRTAAAMEFQESITRLTTPLLENKETFNDSVLQHLSRNYERLRREMPSGAPRTSAMTRIVNEASVRASTALGQARSITPRLLRSSAEGDRIVGLALAQETGDGDLLDDVLHLVIRSSSAFEMFHALLALQEMSTVLDDGQRDRAIVALNDEHKDPRGVGIGQDPGLSYLLPRTLEILRGSE